MRTDILDCGCDDLPHSSRTNRSILAAELRRIAAALEQQEPTA